MTEIFASKTLPAVTILALGSLLFLMDASILAGGLLWLSAIVAFVVQRLRRIWTVVAALVLGIVAISLFPLDGTILPLLLGMASWLKLAERSGPRDRFVAALGGLWLVALGLLMLPPDLALLAIALTLSSLVWALSRDNIVPAGGHFAWAATALPAVLLAALFFVFTPRITGNLNILAFALDLPFIIETEAEAARDPPTKDMALEEFQQKQPDMRVLVADFSAATGPFDKSAPPVNELYWRGPVFWTYETGHWKVRPGFDKRSPRLASKLTGETLEAQIREATRIAMYDVTVFPSRGPWLYSLDIPAFTPPSGYITRDWQLMNMNPIRDLLTYKMMSYVEYRAGLAPDEQTRALGLQLPVEEEPRTIALGRQLAQQHGPDPVAIARAGRAYFASGFSFDRVAEPIRGSNQIDMFLFEVREGYGMQFATAYALMMRAAGIPARVVSGYHGGLHMFLIERVYVTERDSHAWVEIWLDDYGWVRMDVARTAMAEEAADGLAKTADASESETDTIHEKSGPSETVDDTRETPGHWLSQFDAQMQTRLLTASGLNANPGALALSGVVMAGLIVLLFAAVRLVRRKLQQRRLPAVTQLIQRFCRDLAHHGPDRRPTEGLRSYAARILAEAPVGEIKTTEIINAVNWLCAVQYGQTNAIAPPAITRTFGSKRLMRRALKINR